VRESQVMNTVMFSVYGKSLWFRSPTSIQVAPDFTSFVLQIDLVLDRQ
jgi:hypothetical protein